MSDADKVDVLKELVKIACEACEACRADETCKQEAVNWGDFGCVGAEWYIDDEGNTGARVLIEEADPSCYHVQKFIGEYLALRGFGRVEVRAEW